MREAALRDFFTGTLDGLHLAEHLHSSIQKSRLGETQCYVERLAEEFEITSAHLVKLCDAVLEGKLPAELLRTIGFVLISSESFHWEKEHPQGEWVAQVVHDWASPEINYPLNDKTVEKRRHLLLTGDSPFDEADVIDE